tara:strand:- start:1048 stop:1995 length:948 start_codon:yes stop_codon:yes gene_type:complete
MQQVDSSIDFEAFKPAWWATNVHVHTVVSSFITPENIDVKRIEIETPDDDFLEIDLLDLQNDKPIVALFHGLEGSSERPYIRSLMFSLQQEGFSSVALNFRSCGSKMNRQKRLYHSGETTDYATLFNWISQQFPKKEIYAVGFSLGGNALVKSLGEEGNQHPVSRAVAVSPPYSLKGGSLEMSKGFNRVYQKRFIRTLEKKAEQKRISFPDIPTFNGSTVYEFDDQITAPVHRFKNAEDYYAKSSSGPFFEHVRRPLLVIHSKEDSLCPLKFAPLSMIESNPDIDTLFTEQGGHVGFMSAQPGWLNRCILKWLKA